jgi:thiol-disulfide isomerase/thioredoxin
MDRLPALIAFVLCACGSSQTPGPTTTQRTDAVVAPPKKEIGVADFCEQQPKTPFAWPELDEPAPALHGFTWVNVWATWCQPCLEEMGMLREWDQAFDQQGAPVDLVFLSVDSKPEDLTKFKETHPDMPPTLRGKGFPQDPALAEEDRGRRRRGPADPPARRQGRNARMRPGRHDGQAVLRPDQEPGDSLIRAI